MDSERVHFRMAGFAMKRAFLILALLASGGLFAATTGPGTEIPGKITYTGVIIPTALSGDTNNYAPSGLSTCSRINISSTVDCNVTGLTGMADGRQLFVCNVGTNTITLKANSSSSSAGNKFLMANDVPMAAGALVVLTGDGTANGWRITAGGSGGGGSVTAVTAASPLSSSGGTTPQISIGAAIPTTLGGTGATSANAGLNALLPSQTTYAGKVLGTDGTNTSWVTGGGGGTTAFGGLTTTPSTNTTSAMHVGTGASLDATGSGTIVATSCSGNSLTASSAVTLTNADDHTTATTMYPLWTVTQDGNYAAKTSNNLTYNPSTGVFTAAGFSGPLTGAVTGNASSATYSSANTITNDATTATSVYPVWVTANTGNLATKTTSAALSFVPSTGILTATG